MMFPRSPTVVDVRTGRGYARRVRGRDRRCPGRPVAEQRGGRRGGASASALRPRCQARLAVRFEELKSSDGAPEQGKGGETREGTRLTGSGPKSTVHSGGIAVLRRGIKAAWRQLGRSKERGGAEEGQGFI
jgi:hypothetical protein